jgi:hypothetical protein
MEVAPVVRRSLFAAGLLSTAIWVGGAYAGDAKEAKPETYSFGTLRSMTVDAARTQAQEWLAESGKADEASRKQFDAIWSKDNAPLLDKVAGTLALDADAAKLLKEVNDVTTNVPKVVPALLTDKSKPAFYRANLSLLFAKAISSRRVYEEALEALKSVKPEDVVDPSAYFFHKAVAEYALIQKDPACQSIIRLLDDVVDAPDRYKMVATLMFFDMQDWKKDDKDLMNISKLMDNSGRRLDLSRAGQKTQDIQKKIVFRLDEVIKEIENQCKNCTGANQGNCPGGNPNPGNGGGALPSSPMQDSNIATNGGPGKVDEKKLQEIAAVWGKLPEKERAKAMMELTRDLPPRYREIIENYAKSLARGQK